MPYESISELPTQFDAYSKEAKEAAMDAFNGCMYDSEEPDEKRCMRVAHAAAKNAEQDRGGGGEDGAERMRRRRGAGSRGAGGGQSGSTY